MESELPRTQGHHYESTDLSGVEGHREGHHEKTSVLKKVKAKAKKIKNTLITKHGHEHDHDYDHSRDESEEDEDEGMVEDPEIHGAPVYESAAVKNAKRASGGQPSAEETNLDRPSMAGPHNDTPIVDPETRPFVQRQADEEQGNHLLQEDKHAPLPSKPVDARTGDGIYPESPHKVINRRTGRDINEEKENPDQVGAPEAMEGIRGGIGPNIRAHPSNDQVKTIDPAGRGSEETEGITPVIQSFNKMGISEKITKPEQGEGLYTGSHDQIAPESMPHESSDFVPKSYNAANPQDRPRDTFDPASQSSTYTKRITSASAVAASAIAGTAQSAKNVIASKIGQMREPGEGTKSGTSVMGTASDYAHKMAATVTDKLAPVYGKVVGGGSTAKVSGLGAETAQESGANVGQDKGASAKEYWVEKLKPGEEDKVLSTMITESFSKPKGEKMEEVPSDNGGGGHSFSKPKGEKMEEVPSDNGGGRHSISQTVSDAVHKREPEESEEEGKPMGKLTESEEVAKRLGTGEEGSGLENIGSGAGVVNKLTTAIGSWFGGQGGLAKSTPGTTLAGENEGDKGKNT